MAKVELTPDATAQHAKLPRVIQERVRKILVRLKDWPEVSGAKALKGNFGGWYRIRTGDYRLLFRIIAGIVTVEKIGHRSKFYEC